MKAYIFRCNHKTIDEVFSRNLFGEELAVWGIMQNITEGDYLFLYNMTTYEFSGPYKPTSKCEKNIEANAWKNRFPVQVKFTETEDTTTVPYTKIQHIIKKYRNDIFPWPELSEEQSEAIFNIMKA